MSAHCYMYVSILIGPYMLIGCAVFRAPPLLPTHLSTNISFLLGLCPPSSYLESSAISTYSTLVRWSNLLAYFNLSEYTLELIDAQMSL